MRELLKRWAALESNRCKVDEHGGVEVELDGYEHIFDATVLDTEGLAIIQAAVQEAIEAREYNWELSKKGLDPSGKWQRFAVVWPAFGLSKEFGAFSLESSAAALLEAYLQALEAKST